MNRGGGQFRGNRRQRHQASNEHKLIWYDVETLMGDCAVCSDTRIVMKKPKDPNLPSYVYCWFKRVEERFHITYQEYTKILELQSGVCAICEGELTNWHFDHDHETDFIRGILCNACNRGIGYLKDSPKVLRRAAGYLEKPTLFQTAWAKFYKDKETLRYKATRVGK